MNSEEIKPTINVQKLISVFENRDTETQPYFRPRTRSLGHLLAKDVIVQVNDYKTLEDVEKVLDTVEKDLDNYQVYNKAKHVAFQEELFNTLTSIINIDTDDQNKANNLIKKTKMLVSILNNKLPSISTTTNKVTKLQKSDGITNNTKLQEANTKIIDEIDGVVKVSVKDLKEKFQIVHKQDDSKKRNLKTETIYSKKISTQVEKVTNGQPSISISEKTEPTSRSNPPFPADEDYYDPEPQKINKVQVSQLRSLFEAKSQEGATGLPLILKENKPPITRFDYKSNQNTQPEITNSYLPTQPESSRLLSLLEKDNKHFKHELIISEKNEDGRIVQVASKYNSLSSQLEVMENLEPVEDDSTSDISTDSLLSNESLKTVEDLKSVDTVNDESGTEGEEAKEDNTKKEQVRETEDVADTYTTYSSLDLKSSSRVDNESNTNAETNNTNENTEGISREILEPAYTINDEEASKDGNNNEDVKEIEANHSESLSMESEYNSVNNFDSLEGKEDMSSFGSAVTNLRSSEA